MLLQITLSILFLRFFLLHPVSSNPVSAGFAVNPHWHTSDVLGRRSPAVTLIPPPRKYPAALRICEISKDAPSSADVTTIAETLREWEVFSLRWTKEQLKKYPQLEQSRWCCQQNARGRCQFIEKYFTASLEVCSDRPGVCMYCKDVAKAVRDIIKCQSDGKTQGRVAYDGLLSIEVFRTPES